MHLCFSFVEYVGVVLVIFIRTFTIHNVRVSFFCVHAPKSRKKCSFEHESHNHKVVLCWFVDGVFLLRLTQVNVFHLFDIREVARILNSNRGLSPQPAVTGAPRQGR